MAKTIGEKVIGTQFGSTNNSPTEYFKTATAKIINSLADLEDVDHRLVNRAIDRYQEAAMLAALAASSEQ